MKYLFILSIFTIPIMVSADGGIGWFVLFGFMGFVIFAAFLIPIVVLYLLRYKNNLLLLLLDIFFAIIYSLIINFALPTYDVAEMLSFTISTLVVFAILLGIVLCIEKIRGRDISLLGKVFMHGIIVGILTILFAVSFTYGAGRILYSTDCDTNLILNSEFRESELRSCIIKKAVEQTNPVFCNKLSGSWDEKEINFCKLLVNIDMVESGNLSGCSYLKSKNTDVLYYEGTIRGQEILNKCQGH